MVFDQHEAEDLLQEVFIALWNNKHKLNPTHSVAGWLFTASYFKASLHLKKKLKKNIVPLLEEFNDFLSYENDSTAYEEEFSQKLRILNSAIERLPHRKKLAFTLYRLEGKSYEEVASQLSISIESAKDYVKSASKLLKQDIQSQPYLLSSTGMGILLLLLQV